MALKSLHGRYVCPSKASNCRRPLALRVLGGSASSKIVTKDQAHRTSFHHGITYTSYEVNTSLLKFNTSGASVLIDPWLVGDLVFVDQPWFYRGKKKAINRSLTVDLEKLASEVDVMLISQGLDDHCHMPTLQKMPKHIPVVAAPEAMAKLESLGFKNVTQLNHGQSISVADGKLQISGTQGALVGPPWAPRQLGFLLKETVEATPETPGTSVYFESHCDFDEASVKAIGPVDVVISCVKSALISLGPPGVTYPLVMGSINLIKLLSILRPKVLVPLLNTEIEHEGVLATILSEEGKYDSLERDISAAGLETRVEFPAPPGESMAIAL